MTLTEALATTSTRRMIDAIDDLWVSQDGGAAPDKTLNRLMDHAVAELETIVGFRYDPRKA